MYIDYYSALFKRQRTHKTICLVPMLGKKEPGTHCSHMHGITPTFWEPKMWCHYGIGMDGMMWLRMCIWNAMVHFPISTFQDFLITCVQGLSLNLHCSSRWHYTAAILIYIIVHVDIERMTSGIHYLTKQEWVYIDYYNVYMALCKYSRIYHTYTVRGLLV